MKAIIFFSIFFAIAITVNAQQKAIIQDDVPKAVLHAFTVKYPDAIVKKWRKENDSVYIAQSKQKKKEFSATFGGDGNWKNTTTIVDLKEVPGAVRDACYKSLELNWKINSITQIDYSEGTTVYIMEMDNGDKYNPAYPKKIRQVYISPQGTIIKSIRED